MTKQSDESSPSRTISSTTLPPLVHFLRDFFLSKNKSAYLVGGVVRDCLLSRQPQDVDIAVEGDVAVIGAPRHDGEGNNAGAAYVFRWNGDNWFQEQKLIPSDIEPEDEFGWSASVSGNVAVVGAGLDDDAVITSEGW